MGKDTGFKEYARVAVPYQDPLIRLAHYDEFLRPVPEEHLATQGARCMDCGVPFCQSNDGCPIDNLIPEWNDLVYQGRWREALRRLEQTNNFPEFTGRVCPGAVRGRMRPRDHRPGGDDQEHRERNRRPRLRGGLDRPPAAGEADRQEGGRSSVQDPRASPRPRS